MILGLIDRSSSGRRCMVMSVFSRVKEGARLLIWCVCLPR